MLERPQISDTNDEVSLARVPVDDKPNANVDSKPISDTSTREAISVSSQQNPDIQQHEERNTGIVAEVWHAMTETFQDFLKICGEALKAIGSFLGTLSRFGGGGLAWFWAHALKPVVVTLINIGAYFLDKILYGSPGLRQYLHDGLFNSEPPGGWRDFVRQNAGWDIYSSTHPVVDNIFGIFGAGIGLLNIINHTLTSYCHHVNNYSHVLGTYGIFGERHLKEDKRNVPVQVGFGLLSMVGVIPTVIFTNALDAFLTVCKHLAESWFHNQRPLWHVLGKNGVFGERYSYVDENGKTRYWKDKRGWPAIIVYGAFSSPLVVITSLITNVVDGILTICKNFFLSYGRNIRSCYNLLGKHGVMGERTPYHDDRHIITRLVFGFFSSPFVLASAIVTNVIDCAISFVKNFGHLLVNYLRPFAADFFANIGQSFIRNLRATYHLLGKSGVMGERKPYEDDRPLGARIFYGFLTAIPVGLVSLVTNVADAFCAMVKNYFISWFNNQRPLFHVLGKHGIMGDRYSYDDNGTTKYWKDKRGWPAIVAYFLPSLPLVLATSAVTNVLDVGLTVLVQLCKSWFRNQRPLWHLLGKHGVFGERYSYTDEAGNVRHWKDDRSWPEIGIFGFFSSPFVVLTAAATNIVDCVATFFKNFGQSFARNLAPIYHLLGKHGIMGEISEYKDDRRKLTRYAYGAVSGPFVLIAAAFTNIIDAIGAYFKNYKNTIVKPALLCIGIAAVVLTAPFGFILRKMIKGAYNFTIKPVKDCANGEPVSGSRMLKGIANFLTLGLPSAIKKIFKACTGYRDRFGFPRGDNDGSAAELNHFQAVQDTFKEAISLAAHGKFPNVPDGKNHFRMVMRIFYGLRHKVEEVVKAFHDAYIRYAKLLEDTKTPQTDARYSMHGFFQSAEFRTAEQKVQSDLKAEEEMMRNVEGYLSPAAARM